MAGRTGAVRSVHLILDWRPGTLLFLYLTQIPVLDATTLGTNLSRVPSIVYYRVVGRNYARTAIDLRSATILISFRLK